MTVTTTPTRRLVSITATAEILGISARTVHRLIAAGDLDAVRGGRRTIRIKTESIDRLIDAHPVNSWRVREL
jgi:excisionase family DNA binding protein